MHCSLSNYENAGLKAELCEFSQGCFQSLQHVAEACWIECQRPGYILIFNAETITGGAYMSDCMLWCKENDLTHCSIGIVLDLGALEIFVNTGSGNGLLPGGTKPLPEPMLTYHHSEKSH